MHYEEQVINELECAKQIQIGYSVFLYTNAGWAIFSKLIRFASINIHNLKGVKIDHAISVIDVDDLQIKLQESVMFNSKYKWYQKKFWQGCIQEKTFNFYGKQDETNLFYYYKKHKKTLMFAKLAKQMTEEQKVLYKKDCKRVMENEDIGKYNTIGALLSESDSIDDILPNFIQKKLDRKLAKTKGYFCSRLLQKRYYYSHLISDEEYCADPLRSPAQLLKLSCFLKNNGKTQLFVVK